MFAILARAESIRLGRASSERQVRLSTFERREAPEVRDASITKSRWQRKKSACIVKVI